MQNSKLSLIEAYALLPDVVKRCNMKFALISERYQLSSRIIVHKFWHKDQYRQGFEYDWEGSPCEWVFKLGPQCFNQDVQKKFPDDFDLVKLNIQTYIGVPILNESGEAVGHVVVLDDSLIDNCHEVLALLACFAEQIAL